MSTDHFDVTFAHVFPQTGGANIGSIPQFGSSQVQLPQPPVLPSLSSQVQAQIAPQLSSSAVPESGSPWFKIPDFILNHKYKILAVIVLIIVLVFIYYWKFKNVNTEVFYVPETSKKSEDPHDEEDESSCSDSEIDNLVEDVQKKESKNVSKHNLTASEIENINAKLNSI